MTKHLKRSLFRPPFRDEYPLRWVMPSTGKIALFMAVPPVIFGYMMYKLYQVIGADIFDIQMIAVGVGVTVLCGWPVWRVHRYWKKRAQQESEAKPAKSADVAA